MQCDYLMLIDGIIRNCPKDRVTEYYCLEHEAVNEVELEQLADSK